MSLFKRKTLMITGGKLVKRVMSQTCDRHQCGQPNVNLRQVPAQVNG